MRLKLFPSVILLLNAHRLGASVMPRDQTTYRYSETYTGPDFYESWDFETFDDPTHGRVNYLSMADAQAKNLTNASQNKFWMRADADNIVQPNARGRDSIRIISKAAYTEAVTILGLTHMPEGCGTWPAFWSLSQQGPWPNGGELDIIEGVNLAADNLSSLHTMPNCTQSVYRAQRGQTTSTDCDATMNYNTGCGVRFNHANSYGAGFNNGGGGVYAVERSPSWIRIWFWERGDPSSPFLALNGQEEYPQQFSIGPQWGEPDTIFLFDNCDYASHFNAHSMVFDLTFCGDWAGSDFPLSGCGNTACTDLVNNHPEAFRKAYWEIDYLHVYVPKT